MAELKTAIGLMSGTSMDGIDIALLRSDGEGRVERVAAASVAYDAGFRRVLSEALELAKGIKNRNERPENLGETERDLTERHAAAVLSFLDGNALGPADIDVIGFHGQTVLHRPLEALTVQIGDGGLLARMTGIAVVHDMRANDMVHGGQGAPLVPAYHAALAHSISKGVAQPVLFVNIGGISNITYIGSNQSIIACDSGPGNGLIDQWVEAQAGIAYDAGGSIASEGALVEPLVAQYLAHPFFHAPKRMSLDRNDFLPLQANAASLQDGARTLAWISAAAIARTIDRHLPEKPAIIVVCGGGRLNRVIMADLAGLAKGWGGVVRPAEDFGLNGDSMEAEAWAYLAIRSLAGLPLTFPGTTGVSHPVSGGLLAVPG